MGNGENGGNRAGNFQLNASTGVSVLLVIALLGATVTTVYKASEVITDLSYLKADVAEMKRIIQRLDRQQRGSVDDESKTQESGKAALNHIR